MAEVPASPNNAQKKEEPKVRKNKIIHNDKDSFDVKSLGRQFQSKRETAPSFSISKCGRAQRDKVFISKEASNSQVNPDTPGAIYEVAVSTLNLETGQRFGKGPQRTFGRWKAKYPDSSVDTLQRTVDTQPFRYKNWLSIKFGTEELGLTNNIELMKAHIVAFQGKDSPGPQYMASKVENTSKYTTFPKVPFGVKTMVGSMYATSKEAQNNTVGPNSYPPRVSLGKQNLSQNRNAVTHAFPKGSRFGRRAAQTDAPVPDMNLSSFGRQLRNTRRTEPRVGFSNAGRSGAQKMTRCLSDLDKPTALGRQFLSHPDICKESKLIRNSGSSGAFS